MVKEIHSLLGLALPQESWDWEPRGSGPCGGGSNSGRSPSAIATAAARQLPPELADPLKMQSMLEASLEVTSCDGANLEDEVQDWKKVRQLTSQVQAACNALMKSGGTQN